MINTRLRLAILLLAVVAVGLALWFTVGLRVADRFFEPWVVFRVPAHASDLKAQISVQGRTVRICNAGSQPWRDILVRIQGSYVFKMESLKPTECRDTAVDQFAYPSWKKLPPPNNLIPNRVEILVSGEIAGYTSWSSPQR